MKDQVIMAKNGNLAVAIPLFRNEAVEMIGNIGDGYVCCFSNEKPVAYAVDAGEGTAGLIQAEFLEKIVEFLGDLD